MCVLQVHTELVGVQEGGERQHEELDIRRQQQRHDELTFHAAAHRVRPAPRPASPRPPTPHLSASPSPPPGPDAQGSSPRHDTNSALPLLLFDISIYKYIQIYFKASPPHPARLAARTEGGGGSMSEHSESLTGSGVRRSQKRRRGDERTNAGKRSNPLLPALYRNHPRNQVYIFFRNILNNVYNDRL